MLCFLYVIALTILLGVIAGLIEPVLPPRAPRRWLWLIALGLAMTIPAFYRAVHNVPIPAQWTTISSRDPLLIQLWTRASLGLLMWAIASVLLVAYAVRRARKASRSAEVVDGVTVVVTNRLGPATTGFWHARVLLPRWVLRLPDDQRQYIVQHEEEHRKANDARLLFLASLAVIVVPWNIAAWWLVRRLALAIELDCDQRVLRRLGNANSYGALLLDVATAGNRGPRLQPGFIGGAGMLERRLKAMLSPAQLSSTMRILLVCTAVVLLLIALSTPHPVMRAH